MSNSAFYHKPELALRRALELQHIGQPDAALTLLHDVLSSRRHPRTWSLTYEQIILVYLRLCLKLHKAREAKDGLHQYRNLSQSQAPGSLEKVLRFVMEQAELQCSQAKASADALGAAPPDSAPIGGGGGGRETEGDAEGDADNEDDEDDVGDASNLLLSTMSVDPAKTQRDSALLLPSLKLLWEMYRAVLDILRSNSKLEHVYHAAALGALRFCRNYQRRTEFRRLSDLLRTHLGNLQKYGNTISPDTNDDSKTNHKVRGWEGWSPESIELQLQTRFAQLETASHLHLYTEGFRTVEDIYNILQLSSSQARRKLQDGSSAPAAAPKAKLMADYYKQLTTLFWVSENFLFHAFANFKYYALCAEYNRGMNDEVRAELASAVLLAALCIPTLPASSIGSDNSSPVSDGAPSRHNKMARMATLLGFHTRHPTREALLEEIQSKGLISLVPDYLQQLYRLLETNSDPLVLVSTAQPLLEELSKEAAKENDLARYIRPLKSVLLLKLLLNLNAAYHTVRIDHLRDLCRGLGSISNDPEKVSSSDAFEHVEKAIVQFTQSHKSLSVRIDHRAGCLRFGDVQLESDAMRSQLTVLARRLHSVTSRVPSRQHQMVVSAKTSREAQRIHDFQLAREKRRKDHEAMISRKDFIEQQKETTERKAQEKVREEKQKKIAEAAKRKQEEEARKAKEFHERELEKQRKIQQELENMKKQQLLAAMGQNTSSLTAEDLSKLDTSKLQKEHQEKLNKEREEAERKTKETAKRLDYLVRAVRIEELPQVKAKYEEKTKQDKERYERFVVEKTKRAKFQWESDKKEREPYAAYRVFEFMNEYKEKVMEGRRLEHIEIRREAERQAEIDAERAKLARARKRKQDKERQERLEQERLEREEQERLEQEAKERREQARRELQAQEEARRQAEEARMAEQQNRDRQQQQERAPRPSRGLDRTSGGSGSGGRYVPPSRRGEAGGSRFDDRGGSSRFGSSGGDRYAGGGRYERGPGGNGDRRSGGYGDRRTGEGGSSGRGGPGGYDDRDRPSGGSDRDRGGLGSYGDRDSRRPFPAGERRDGGDRRRW